MKNLWAFITFIVVSVSAFSEEIIVYRWVDKNNVVHFSQNQPEHDNYTQLSMTNTPRAKDKDLTTEINLKGNKSPQLVDLKEKCDTATANLRTLKAFDKIQYTDEKGVSTVLTEEEKSKQLALNEKQVEVYCNQ